LPFIHGAYQFFVLLAAGGRVRRRGQTKRVPFLPILWTHLTSRYCTEKRFLFCLKNLAGYGESQIEFRLVNVEMLFVKNGFFHIAKNFFLEDYVIASVVR
jgi:hypothetical protein